MLVNRQVGTHWLRINDEHSFGSMVFHFLVLRKWEFVLYERSDRCHGISSFLSQPTTGSEVFALYTCFETITFVLQGVCSNKSRYGSIDNFGEKYVIMKRKKDAQTRLWLSAAIREINATFLSHGWQPEVRRFPILLVFTLPHLYC